MGLVIHYMKKLCTFNGNMTHLWTTAIAALKLGWVSYELYLNVAKHIELCILILIDS